MNSAATEARTGSQILVIGYGNTLRRDDGAGVKLAERLAVGLWAIGGSPLGAVKLLTVHQLTPELAAEIAADPIATVVFVDAEAGLREHAIRIRRVDAAGASPSLGHHLDPTALLTYARMLYGRTVPAWLVTVPGVDFDHGEVLSPSVHRLLCNAAWLAEKLAGDVDREVGEEAICTN